MMRMLRISRVRRPSSQPYICWKCAANCYTGVRPQGRYLSINATVRDKITEVRARRIGQDGSKRSFSITQIKGAEVEEHNTLPKDQFPHGDAAQRKVPIRERLQLWEAENADKHVFIRNEDDAGPGLVGNSSTRVGGDDFKVDEGAEAEVDDLNFTQDDLLDIGSRRGYFVSGDLVELIGKGNRNELAIYVCDVEGKSQFYTMSGSWVNATVKAAGFYVPSFVEPHEVEVLRPYLPLPSRPQTDIERLRNIIPQVPRNLGKPLIQKMLRFWSQADDVYHSAGSRLDNAHSLVAHKNTFRYATLEELANELLPETVKIPGQEKHSHYALYAVHRTLLRDDLGFRPQLRGATRTGGQYEISSLSEVQNMYEFMKIIQQYQEAASHGGRTIKAPKDLVQCIEECRRLIDLSRRSRPLTPHGTVGPLSTPTLENDIKRNPLRNPILSKAIAFMESWAALRTIGLFSTLNATGSTFLRIIKRYEKLPLTQSTAWTFLQEIGVTCPSASRVPYDLRVPKVGLNLQSEPGVTLFPIEDSMSSLRMNFDHLPVYCIDGADAHEIDDGISVERTAAPDEYWVHIHTADPASRIHPKNSSSIAAQTETIYLPQQVFFMIPSEFVQSELSLGPNRPSLTFSAKMNLNGDILESRISAQTIHDVKFLTPAVVEEAITGVQRPEPVHTHLVGSSGAAEGLGEGVADTLPENATTNEIEESVLSSTDVKREMLEVSKLSENLKDDLRILEKLGEARLNQRRARGGVTINLPKAKISVSFPGTVAEDQTSPSSSDLPMTDPIIKISEDGDSAARKVDVVAPMMLIAGEIAARWCHERGIPIPYRVSPRTDNTDNPAKFYQEVVLPSLDAQGIPPAEIAKQYFRLLGTVVPSTTPGPHLGIGVEMMAKCTSPLRRFGDLLLHWQIHAALREEARLGQNLIGNEREDFLPFSKADVDRMLVHVDSRERMLKLGQRNSTQEWLCHFLIRAWRFKEAPLPATFEFVAGTKPMYEEVFGNLSSFASAMATMVGSDTVRMEDVKEGQKFEVELVDVNVYMGNITVKALRRLE
ncbi:3'-5' RNA exonuclease complex component [Clarireedia jacksonii]